MREILFRGKRVDNGEWVYGYYVKPTHHWHEHGIHDDWIIRTAYQNGGYFNVVERYAVVPETVGQFTGLTDKNGKKIFEGDIVEYKDCPASDYYRETIICNRGVIEFSEGQFYVTERETVEMDDLIYENTMDSEVIGNIYDNKELIGK